MTTRKKPFDPDNPPLTREFVMGMRPYHDVHPEYKLADEAATKQRKLGRPAKADPTVNLTIRVRESYLPKLRKIPRYQTMITKLIHTWVDA